MRDLFLFCVKQSNTTALIGFRNTKAWLCLYPCRGWERQPLFCVLFYLDSRRGEEVLHMGTWTSHHQTNRSSAPGFEPRPRGVSTTLQPELKAHTHTHTVSGSLYDSLSWQSTTGPISANYSQRHLELLSNKTGTVHSAMCRSLDVYSRRHHRANLRPGGSEEVTLWWEWWRLWRQPEGGGRSQVKVKESWLTLVLSTKSW